MKNDELKEVLKMDFPEYKVDNDKIISFCKNNKTKNYKKRIILAYAIPSIILLIGIITLSIVLLKNRVPSNVVNINNSINSLEEISNDEEKIKEIMKIDKEIQTISETDQTYINNSKLSFETQNSVLNLKNSVEWKNVLDQNNYYITLEEVLKNDTIKEIKMIKGRYNSQCFISTNDHFNEDLLLLFNLPYIDIIDKSESFHNEYKDILSGDYNNEYTFFLMDNNSKETSIRVYDSGYILISIANKNENIDKTKYESLFISLIPLNKQNFLKYVGNLNIDKKIENPFKLCDVFDEDIISLINITNDINMSILGEPSIYIRNEDFRDFYERYLKDLVFVDNEEIARDISNKLSNDYTAININFKNGDSAAIFVSHKDHSYILIHGMTQYAGVGKLEKGFFA